MRQKETDAKRVKEQKRSFEDRGRKIYENGWKSRCGELRQEEVRSFDWNCEDDDRIEGY